MTDPRRLRDAGSELKPWEREVLASADGDEPDGSVAAAGWERLSAALGGLAALPGLGAGGSGHGGAPPGTPVSPAAVSTASGGGLGAPTALTAGTLKVLGIGFGAGMLVATVVDAPWRAPPPSPRAPSATVVAAPGPSSTQSTRTESTAPGPAELSRTSSREVARPSRRGGDDAPSPAWAPVEPPSFEAPVRPPAAAIEEAELVRRAREALRAGEWAAAGHELARAGVRFPQGMLLEEREALAVELLFRTGQRATATVRARAFLAAHPTSAHASRLRAFLGSDATRPVP
jgi:hypothetical protein